MNRVITKSAPVKSMHDLKLPVSPVRLLFTYKSYDIQRISSILILMILAMLFTAFNPRVFAQSYSLANNSSAHSNPLLYAANAQTPVPMPLALTQRDMASDTYYVKDRILIKLKDNPPVNTMSLSGNKGVLTANSRLDGVLAAQGILELEAVYQQPRSSLSPMSLKPEKSRLSRWHRAKMRENSDIAKVIQAIAQDPDIECAEPDYLLHLAGNPSVNAIVHRTIKAAGLPALDGDPLLSQQWHLDAIKAREAWAHLEGLGLPPGGSHNVIVAVIDSGVDYNHQDLAVNMWNNSQEVAGNGTDDDGNGIVDDVHGANFVGSHSGNPMDDNGHGTHVAGIIAAQASNGLGGVGVAYNVQILPIKAANASGILVASDIAEAIQYAVARQVDVINMSFAGTAKPLIVEDALATAFNQSVLVAAAGNQRWPNLPYYDPINKIYGTNYYPAAYNWILGVMSSDQNGSKSFFSNWDCTPEDESEYEIMGPGVSIWSCLPNNQYAAWSGTSMSAPIVSGIAALLRSKYPDKNLYPSRFIMGQIASTAVPAGSWRGVNAIAALTQTPIPKISITDYRVFDSSQIAANNDQDGNIDAGETVDLAIFLRNHWGTANQVTAKLEAKAGLLPTHPYVTMISDTVDFGSMGTFANSDNGVTRDANNLITGIQHPFRLLVSSECPNTYIINFLLTITARYGSNPNNQSVIITNRTFDLTVQRGSELPSIISQNMTLTKNHFWIVPDKTVVSAGATLTIGPGARVQFGGRLATGVYQGTPNPMIQVEGNLNIEGTTGEPVELYGNKDSQTVVITEAINGILTLKYARIKKGNITGASADHCYFEGYTINDIHLVSNSRYIGSLNIAGGETNLFANNLFCNQYHPDYWWIKPCIRRATGNVFIKNRYNGNGAWQIGMGSSIAPVIGAAVFPTNAVVNGEMKTYFLLPAFVANSSLGFELAERIAREYGGHLADITSAEETQFIKNYLKTMTQSNFDAMYNGALQWWAYKNERFVIGLYRQADGSFAWSSGAPYIYTSWRSGDPQPATNPYYNGVTFLLGGQWEHVNINQPYLVELPGSYSQAQLNARRTSAAANATRVMDYFRHNAVLNNWLENNIANWIRPYSNGQAGSSQQDMWAYAIENFWGTTSRVLIDAMINDFKDSYTSGPLIYEPILTNAPVDCYPFVVNVSYSNSGGENVSVVGVEPITFRVAFNRDMNTTIQPQVSFGPSVPYTDYTINGAWETARIWKGIFNISPITGDGYQYVRVAGAVAADDPWLITGPDAERFAFQVRTVGTLSMNLQAQGLVGKVHLSWTQDNFDLLAGYHLYRSTNPTNNFSRINTTIIPQSQKSFDDTTASPGQVYYYRFSVVQTDMSESASSNTADAAPVDTILPTINHTKITQAPPGLPLTLIADIVDNVKVTQATLYFRTSRSSTYTAQTMTKTKDRIYSTTIEGAKLVIPGLEYYIEATDSINTAQHGTASSPNVITVVDQPTIMSVSPQRGAASGGSLVSITGINFKSGATVSFGGVAANNVVWISDQHLTCLTPAKSASTVNVQIINPDGKSSSLSQGFTFFSETALLSIPSIASAPLDVIDVPINFSNVRGLLSSSITLSFDASVVQIRSARLGSLVPGWSLIVNTNQSGQIGLSILSPGSAVNGEGCAIVLECIATANGPASCTISFTSMSLNNGALSAQTSNGSFSVLRTFTVSGYVNFWNGGAAVTNVDMTLQGTQVFTGLNSPAGLYQVADFPAGSYTLIPSKSDQVCGISAFDASLVLKHITGVASLSANSALAADVDRNGKIDAMDAYYILQKSINAITLPFPKAGKVWIFNPSYRSISRTTNDTQNLSGQAFTAILLGDVSGNWSSSGVVTGQGISADHIQNTTETKAGLLSLGLKRQAIENASFQSEEIKRNVTIAIYKSNGQPGSPFKVMYHTRNQPIHSIDFRLKGASKAISCLSQFMMATAFDTEGILHGAMAGAVPIEGSGILLEAYEFGEDLSIEDATINEGESPVNIVDGNTALDTDSDGQNDWNEIVSGTNPHNFVSTFKLLRIEPLGNGMGCQVIWNSVIGRKYVLEAMNASGGSAWLPVSDPIEALGYETSATDTRSTCEARFYRVRLAD